MSAPLDAARLADDIEAQAYADLFLAAPAPLKARLGLRVERVADATLLLAPGLPASMFNRAIGLGLRQEARVRDVEAIIEAYRRAGSGDWWLHWNPLARPEDMPRRLAQKGFTQPARRAWAKMLRAAAAPPTVASDLRIEPASPAAAAEVARIAAEAFEMPPFMAEWLFCLHGRPRWRMYAVGEGSTVVGGGYLFTDGKLAWLGMGSVAPPQRRRGGQGALMARRIADAAAAGARWIVTETGEPIGDEPNPSLANMKRCGFAAVASRLNFAGPASA